MRTTKERAGRRSVKSASGDARGAKRTSGAARGARRSTTPDREAAAANTAAANTAAAKPSAAKPSAAKPSAAKPSAAKPARPTNGARRDRASRGDPGERSLSLVDRVTAAWGAIVVERIGADQDFAEAFERYHGAPKDIRAVFAWDEVLSAEAHLALVNGIIARHLDDAGRGDPFAILEELRDERRRLAAVYAVNAFRAVLGQMSRRKPRWRSMEGGDFDERIAVLALAHQALAKALETARVPSPGDLTEPLLAAAQDPRVWDVRDSRSDGLLLASTRAAEAFFERIGDGTFADAAEIGRLYLLQPVRGARA